MDISLDQLRRDAAETQVEHRRVMNPMRELVSRLFLDDRGARYATRTKSDLVLGGFDRRRFLRISGVTVASAAVLAACGGDDNDDATTGTTTGGGASTSQDITILRTASSIERLAVDVYQTAIDSGLVTTAAVGSAAGLFQAQHVEHAELFEGATSSLGGEPFTTANTAVLELLQPTIDGLSDELGVIQLAYDLEAAAAATYFSTVGVFDDASLNTAAMSVGGVEARHVAVLGNVLSELGDATRVPVAANGFQTAEGAVPAGTGV